MGSSQSFELQASRPCPEVVHRHTACPEWWLACGRAGFLSGARFRPRVEIFTKTLPAIARSSLFLGTNSFLYPLLMCAYSRKLGQPHGKLAWFLGPSLAAFLAILIEKRGRRKELAVFMLNQASEALYKSLLGRGLVPEISRGTDVLFALSFATLVLLMKTRSELVPGSARVILKTLVGEETKPDRVERLVATLYKKWHSFVGDAFPSIFSKDEEDKSRICKHHSGCKTFGIVGFIKAFLIALGIKSAFVLPAALFAMGPIKFVLRFKSLLMKILTRSTLNFALFFAIMSGGTRSANCFLRYLRGVDDGVNTFLSGLVGSLGVVLFSSVDFAMYIVSKAVEGLFSYGVEEQWLHKVPLGSALLYALSTGFLFVIAAYEPHYLRKSYWDFLMKTSNGHWMHFNLSFTPVRFERGITSYSIYTQWAKDVAKNLIPKFVSKHDLERLYRQHFSVLPSELAII